jgi:hypothetical protein
MKYEPSVSGGYIMTFDGWDHLLRLEIEERKC